MKLRYKKIRWYIWDLVANVTDNLSAAQRVHHDEQSTDGDHAAVGEAGGEAIKRKCAIRDSNKKAR